MRNPGESQYRTRRFIADRYRSAFRAEVRERSESMILEMRRAEQEGVGWIDG